MRDRIINCIQVIRSAFDDQLEIYLPSEQDTEDCVFFQLNDHAKVNVFVEQETYHVYVTAFYGESDSAIVKTAEEIPKTIDCLYNNLIGPLTRTKNSDGSSDIS